ncbi:sugar ABC transporter substrate-binding protein [Planobispora longispora]|uniref:Sugar ABC transporter substrate-binding protein n=1 Tax=Planobispora longispora TaxID=28887 RepID=A0A8J3RKG3_9ACTN|nr:substrate-binding domain-containing protein [Planobispora longispora]BFE81527.1 substrate-binding domain-containing protein [Planobispora longispora]GIH76613.1 sugar ABC transporter substrate-binding protein [Planobispora longispora]
MRKGILSLTAAAAAMTLGLTACGSEGGDTGAQASPAPGESKPAAAGKIGVILPDSKSSARWETADRKYLEEAFKAAGVAYDIQNAQGDKTQFQTIADQMITNGATVLMIVNLDSGTGKAVLEKAKSQGVATIDYDRLTLGGGAAYYVSFDNTKVGTLQGEGLVKCLTDKKAEKPIVAYLNGSPTDNNATLFKNGYDGVLKPKFDAGEYVKGPEQSVENWDNTKAGTLFEQMLTEKPDIAGVLAANDGLGNAAITVLKKNKLNGKVPVTGQDATVQGLQNILAGDQCMTVYKAIKKEAEAASALAIGLAKGEKPAATGTVKDTESGADVPAVLLDPQPIFFESVKDVVADGFVTKEELCTGDFAAKCTEAGIQ